MTRGAASPARSRSLPQSAARLVGLAALALVGALEWQRLVAASGPARALLWVAVARRWPRWACCSPSACRGRPRGARAAGGRARRRCSPAIWLAGLALDLLRPRHWDDLLAGLGGGLQALGTVRLPYVSADPWPGSCSSCSAPSC